MIRANLFVSTRIPQKSRIYGMLTLNAQNE